MHIYYLQCFWFEFHFQLQSLILKSVCLHLHRSFCELAFLFDPQSEVTPLTGFTLHRMWKVCPVVSTGQTAFHLQQMVANDVVNASAHTAIITSPSWWWRDWAGALCDWPQFRTTDRGKKSQKMDPVRKSEEEFLLFSFFFFFFEKKSIIRHQRWERQP